MTHRKKDKWLALCTSSSIDDDGGNNNTDNHENKPIQKAKRRQCILMRLNFFLQDPHLLWGGLMWRTEIKPATYANRFRKVERAIRNSHNYKRIFSPSLLLFWVSLDGCRIGIEPQSSCQSSPRVLFVQLKTPNFSNFALPNFQFSRRCGS